MAAHVSPVILKDRGHRAQVQALVEQDPIAPDPLCKDENSGKDKDSAGGAVGPGGSTAQTALMAVAAVHGMQLSPQMTGTTLQGARLSPQTNAATLLVALVVQHTLSIQVA